MKNKFMDRDLRSIFTPKIWLLIVVLPHTILGSLYPLTQADVHSNAWTLATFGLLNTVVLLSIYFFTEGKSQARMTAVIAGAVFCWIIMRSIVTDGDDFDITAVLDPPFIYKFSFSIELAPPLILWGILSITGIIHWNGPRDPIQENSENDTHDSTEGDEMSADEEETSTDEEETSTDDETAKLEEMISKGKDLLKRLGR